jgi:tmRNA-binding protein
MTEFNNYHFNYYNGFTDDWDIEKGIEHDSFIIDINEDIYIDNTHIKSHTGMMKVILEELVSRFLCLNCDEIKPAQHFNDDVCCSVCYMQWRDNPYKICM